MAIQLATGAVISTDSTWKKNYDNHLSQLSSTSADKKLKSDANAAVGVIRDASHGRASFDDAQKAIQKALLDNPYSLTSQSKAISKDLTALLSVAEFNHAYYDFSTPSSGESSDSLNRLYDKASHALNEAGDADDVKNIIQNAKNSTGVSQLYDGYSR